MRSTLVATMLLLSLWACKTGPDPELEAIAALEKEVDAGASAEKMEELVALYEKYIERHPDETENNANFLHKAAYIQFNGRRYLAAVQFLKEALKQYYDSDKTPDNALFLASIYKAHLNSPAIGDAAYYAFLQAFPNHEKAAFVRDSVLVQPMDLTADVDSLRSKLFDEKASRYNTEVSNDFIGTCEMYALLLPDDEKAPDLLFEAARTAGYIRAFPKAVELYDWAYAKYPDFPKASQALFMMAFTYDNEMHNVEKARSLYEEFLKKYPDDEFTDDAQVLLQNLGKSEEEILKDLQKKKKKG